MIQNNSFSCFGNVSDSSLSEIWTIDRRTNPEFQDYDPRISGYVISALAILLVCTGVPWNLFIVYIIFKKRLHDQPTIVLLLNLILTNLILALFLMPLTIVTGIEGEYIFGSSCLAYFSFCFLGCLFTLSV